MALLKIGGLMLLAMTLEECMSNPGGGGGGHVHHRIHVPTRVKTVYHTKIIKIPQHHHHYHEKEKPHLIKVPEHHHYFHEKEKSVDWHNYNVKEDEEEYGHEYRPYDHNIFKKHAPPHLYRKKKRH